MNQLILKNLIIYLLFIWLVQFDLVSLVNANNSTSSLSSLHNHKLSKPAKLKSTKLTKKTFKQPKNSTSLSPAKLDAAVQDAPKTFYQISRDGRHQMLAFGSEITLANQMQQLVFEQNFA